MKKNPAVFIAAAAVLFIGGCVSADTSKDEETVDMTVLTAEERKAYIESYFEENYDEAVRVSEVKRREINSIRAEEFYFATAYNSEDKKFSVFLYEDGTIKETMFALELYDELQYQMTEALSEYISDFDFGLTYFFIFQPLKGEWSAADNLLEMINTEESIGVRGNLILNDVTQTTQDALKQIFYEHIITEDFSSTMDIYVYDSSQTDENSNLYDDAEYDIWLGLNHYGYKNYFGI